MVAMNKSNPADFFGIPIRAATENPYEGLDPTGQNGVPGCVIPLHNIRMREDGTFMRHDSARIAAATIPNGFAGVPPPDPLTEMWRQLLDAWDKE